jgi:hypothetical protein
MGYYFFLVFMNLRFQPQYFYPENYRKHFPIATPAARAAHSPRWSLSAASPEILIIVIPSSSVLKLFTNTVYFYHRFCLAILV